MNSDDLVWQVVKNQFCSYKVRVGTNHFCRNEYNVTGQCNRSSCPLANSRYSTVREEGGRLFLYVKTPERSHCPARMWERVKLPGKYVDAIDVINRELQFWPAYQLHKCKQRLTKLTQLLVRTRRLKLKGTSRPTLIGISKKVERREVSREAKAEKIAKIEKAVERELLARLHSHAYGDAPLNVDEDVWKQVLDAEAEAIISEEDDDDEEAEEDDDEDEIEVEEEQEREFVSDFEESDSEVDSEASEESARGNGRRNGHGVDDMEDLAQTSLNLRRSAAEADKKAKRLASDALVGNGRLDRSGRNGNGGGGGGAAAAAHGKRGFKVRKTDRGKGKATADGAGDDEGVEGIEFEYENEFVDTNVSLSNP